MKTGVLRMMSLGIVSLVIFTGTGVVSAPPAAALCTKEAFVAGSSFSYRLCTMTDIDQRRTDAQGVLGLPNGGAMYCVPTAVVDAMAYIANHGYPSLAPGPGNWQKPSKYNAMSFALAFMGTLMGTDPVNGTGGDGAESGLKQWILNAGLDGWFTVSHYYAGGFSAPTFKDMANAALSGDLVIPVVGWYKNADDPLLEKTRAGGHAFALSGGAGSLKDFFYHQIGFADPANPNDGMTTTQSTFVKTLKDVKEVYANFDGVMRTQSRVVDYGSAYLDEYFAVRPNFGLFGSEDEPLIVYLAPVLNVLDTFGGGEVHPAVEKFPTPTGTQVIDIAVHPEGSTHPFIVEGSSAIWQLDVLTGRASRFAGAPGAKRLAFGKDEVLYVLKQREIVAFDKKAAVLWRTTLPRPLDAVAVEGPSGRIRGGGNRLFGVSGKAGRLYAFDSALNPLFDTAIPQGVGNLSGNLRLGVSPIDGSLWLHSDGSPTVSRLVLGSDNRIEATEVPLQGAVAPTGLQVDDQGNLYVTDGGVVQKYDASGRPLDSNAFSRLPGGSTLSVVHSFTNFDPAIDVGPAYYNVLPEDAPPPTG
jgi:hypothetical protein